MVVSIGQASEIIGVSISTLRRWEEEGSFLPDFRTKGHHRRYSLDRINKEILGMAPQSHSTLPKTYGYARVSSHDQKMDLKRQEKRLSQYCKKNNWDFEIISDLGSGINYKKRGLNKLLKLM